MGLPMVAAGIAMPGAAHAADNAAVGQSMAAFAAANAGDDAASRAKAKEAHYLARKADKSAGDCMDCDDCGRCQTCAGCDEADSGKHSQGQAK